MQRGEKISALFEKRACDEKLLPDGNAEYLSRFNQKVTHEIICLEGRTGAQKKSWTLQKQPASSDSLHDVDVPA